MTLEEWMNAQGHADLDVAELVGINRATVSKLRRGKKLPSPRLMAIFARVTDRSVMPNDWLSG
jgi:transcriptional regulator with XRE-family HTH domain